MFEKAFAMMSKRAAALKAAKKKHPELIITVGRDGLHRLQSLGELETGYWSDSKQKHWYWAVTCMDPHYVPDEYVGQVVMAIAADTK